MPGKEIISANLLDFIPKMMKHDKTACALSKVTSPLLQGMGERCYTLPIWHKIDELEESFLDELAWELNIDWYDYAAPIEQKRQAIKTSELIHSRRGTKWAVEQVIQIYFGKAKVMEWFEYGGDPYFFRIQLENMEQLEGEQIRKFIRALRLSKNVRSWLEKFVIDLTVPTNWYQGTVYQDGSVESYFANSPFHFDGGKSSLSAGFAYHECTRETHFARVPEVKES